MVNSFYKIPVVEVKKISCGEELLCDMRVIRHYAHVSASKGPLTPRSRWPPLSVPTHLSTAC